MGFLSVRTAARKGTESIDRKSTRLNSSHANISYAVFCLKKNELELTETLRDYVGHQIHGLGITWQRHGQPADVRTHIGPPRIVAAFELGRAHVGTTVTPI